MRNSQEKKEQVEKMKKLVILTGLFLIFIVACQSTIPQPKQKLSQTEIKEICSKHNLVISDALKKRLIADSKELKLTPEELQVLKSTGKVILCGKCGYILNSLKEKEYKTEKIKQHTGTKTGFRKDSLRQRIIMTYTN